MKYAGLPSAMWTFFAGSFTKNLIEVMGYDADAAKEIKRKAKPKYREIISELPEFEKADHFKTNIVNCAMLCAFILNMPKRPDVETLTVYFRQTIMTPLVRKVCRMSAKNKYTKKGYTSMRATAELKAADRNPFSWNMDMIEYEDGSGYEARFYKCGICELMKKFGLFDLTPAMCRLDYDMSEAGGGTDFIREYTLASGGPYCDCGYHKK